MEEELNLLIKNYYTTKSEVSFNEIIYFIKKHENFEFEKLSLSEQTYFFLGERKIKLKIKRQSPNKTKGKKHPRWGYIENLVREEIKNEKGEIIKIRHRSKN